MDVLVSQDGTIVETETEVPMAEVPQPAADAITKEAKGATVFKVERVEVGATVRSGQIVKLDKPEVFYEAKWRERGFVRESKVAPDGSRR